MGISGVSDISQKYEDMYDNFVHSKYEVNLSFFLPWGYDWTSEVLVIKLAILLNVIFFNHKIVDIRFLSIIFIIIFTFAIFLIIKYFNKVNNLQIFKWILGIFIFLVFTDIGYISYFNSFFGEATTFVFLFLTIGAAMYLLSSEKPTKFQVAFFMISSMFFLTAKQQNIPSLAFMCIFYARIWFLLKDKNHKKLLLMLIGISIIISVFSYISIGKITTICNKYQSVFFGLLKDSPTPEKDLEALGIDKSFAVLKNTVFFDSGLPINPMDKSLDNTLYNKISSLKLLRFYLQHPQRLYTKISETSLFSFDYFEINKGNYEKDEYDKSNKKYNVFRTWVSIKYQKIYRNLFYIFIFTFFYFSILLFNYIKAKDKFKKAYIELLIIIGLIGLSQYILPIIVSGSGDLSKHLFLLNFSYDTMSTVAFMWIIINSYIIFNKVILQIRRNYQGLRGMRGVE